MKITCKVIEDLLPLYVDEVLSEDSKALVEEHLAECGDCRDRLKKMQFAAFPVIHPAKKDKKNKEREALLKIRKKIRKKRITAVLAAVLCVVFIFSAGHYMYYERKIYIPFEETGLRVEADGKIYSDKNWYGRLYGIVSRDQKVQFLVETETPYIRNQYPAKDLPEDRLVMDLYVVSSPGGDTETTIPSLEKVYYLSEEYVDFIFSEDEQKAAEELKELEEHSILLWEKGEKNAEKDAVKETSQREGEPVRFYQGTRNVSTFSGRKWTPPKGSYADENGVVYDQSGTVIGVNEKFRPDGNGVG